MQDERLTTLRRIADACFPPPATTFTEGLTSFQCDAVDRIRFALATRHGAVLADSVGLGKTHIAGSLIRMETAAGGATLVTAPSALRSHWHRHLHGTTRWSWLSHASLSRMSHRPHHSSLVVVDEAHAFRNPDTRRYSSLALACEHARVLLITATPVNNSLHDFYHLLRLFAPDDLFTDLGVPHLRTAIEAALDHGDIRPVQRIVNAIMIRRTRASPALTRQHTPAAHAHNVETAGLDGAAVAKGNGPRLGFPAPHAVETVTYQPATSFTHAIRLVIPVLHFAAHRHTGSPASRELMRLGLLKRLESSTHAFRTSVQRHLRLLECFARAAGAGRLFDPTLHQSLASGVDGSLQLSLESLVLPAWPEHLDRLAAIDSARQDIAALRSLTAMLPAETSLDTKLARLHALLDELGDETILLFTEYRDTATSIWRSLAHHDGIALIHGSGAFLGQRRAARRTIIERFAPVANGARAPRPSERVRLLIATDVLAEGLNLQDARIAISFDLPWNPVRLAQRIGRIDRLGSPHTHIRALAFTPHHELDEMLRLRAHIRNKLRQIRIVGGDAPAFRSSRRRVTTRIDQSAHALERARTALARITARDSDTDTAAVCAPSQAAPPLTTFAPHGPSDPPHATIVVNASYAGSLCCFISERGSPLLVYKATHRRSTINTPEAWLALAHAAEAALNDMSCSTTRPFTTSEVVETARTALASLRRDTHENRRPHTLHHDTATSVMRWLASRPGGPSRADIDSAETILLRLAAHSRAGRDTRLRDIIHSPPHRLIPQLRTILDSSDDPAHARSSTTPGPAVTPAFNTTAPTLVGVLILLPGT